MKKKIRVMLVDDHAMLRDGLAAILRQSDELEIVSALSSGEEAINALAGINPDLIIMDILMGGMNGLEATRWIKEQKPDVKVVVVTSELKKEWVSLGIKCGIDGYLPKDVGGQELLAAIRQILQGEKYFTQAITNLYTAEKSGLKPKRKISAELTKRENEVLALVAEGHTNKEIADQLFVSIKTVETHKTNILEKLGLRNTAELVRYAIKSNIISID
jgi:DNA-binding NarL/FixJ family response regulator